MIKSDTKDIYYVTKIYIKKMVLFWTSIHQRIKENIKQHNCFQH